MKDWDTSLLFLCPLLQNYTELSATLVNFDVWNLTFDEWTRVLTFKATKKKEVCFCISAQGLDKYTLTAKVLPNSILFTHEQGGHTGGGLGDISQSPLCPDDNPDMPSPLYTFSPALDLASGCTAPLGSRTHQVKKGFLIERCKG